MPNNIKLSQLPVAANTATGSLQLCGYDPSLPTGSQNVTINASGMLSAGIANNFPTVLNGLGTSPPVGAAGIWNNNGILNFSSGSSSYSTPTFYDINIANSNVSGTAASASLALTLDALSAQGTLSTALATQALSSLGGTLSGNLYLTSFQSNAAPGIWTNSAGLVQPITLSSRFNYSQGSWDLNVGSASGTLVALVANGDAQTAGSPIVWSGNCLATGTATLTGTIALGASPGPITPATETLVGTIHMNGATTNNAVLVSCVTDIGAAFFPKAYVTSTGTVSVYLANMSSSLLTPTGGSVFQVRVLP